MKAWELKDHYSPDFARSPETIVMRSAASIAKELNRLVHLVPRRISLTRTDQKRALEILIGGPWIRIVFYPSGFDSRSDPLIYVPPCSTASSPVVFISDGLQHPIHPRWLAPNRAGIEAVVHVCEGLETPREFTSHLAEVTSHADLCDEAWAQAFPDEWAKRASFWKPCELPKLAGKECEIQQLLSEDVPKEEIAQLFGVSPGTLTNFTERMNEHHDNS